jgi:hypothetical protein
MPQGWYMPGMRVLADLRCPQCNREYYGDLRTGHGLYYPKLLDKATGQVYDEDHATWFAHWLQVSYRQRSSEALPFQVEEFRSLRKVLLLNCLDVLYGHSLLKLLNAQYYLDHAPEYDLVVIVPEFMRWLVPDGVAAIWTVKLPLRRGIEWNDWLASEIHRRLDGFEQAWISVGYSHPHASHFDIARFTRIAPFDVNKWDAKPLNPVVTFIWRDDRRWQALTASASWPKFTAGFGTNCPKLLALSSNNARLRNWQRHCGAMSLILRLPSLDPANQLVSPVGLRICVQVRLTGPLRLPGANSMPEATLWWACMVPTCFCRQRTQRR